MQLYEVDFNTNKLWNYLIPGINYYNGIEFQKDFHTCIYKINIGLRDNTNNHNEENKVYILANINPTINVPYKEHGNIFMNRFNFFTHAQAKHIHTIYNYTSLNDFLKVVVLKIPEQMIESYNHMLQSKYSNMYKNNKGMKEYFRNEKSSRRYGVLFPESTTGLKLRKLMSKELDVDLELIKEIEKEFIIEKYSL